MRNLAYVQERKPTKAMLVCIRRLLSLSYYRAISSRRILSFKPSGTELTAFEAFPTLAAVWEWKGTSVHFRQLLNARARFHSLTCHFLAQMAVTPQVARTVRFSAFQPLFRLTLLSSASHRVSAWRGYHYPDIGPLSQVERFQKHISTK